MYPIHRLLNPLDVVRLAQDEYEPTLAAVRQHFDQPASHMTYRWLYANARFAIAPEPRLSREAVLAGIAKAGTKKAQEQNLECWKLVEGMYADKTSTCWDIGEVNLGFGRTHFIPVRPCAVRLDQYEKRAAVVVVQPRKSFAPDPERLGMLGYVLAEACIPKARDSLFAATPSIDITVEFANLGTALGSKLRVPRLQRIDDFPAVDAALVKRRIANLAKALDVVRAEAEEKKRKKPSEKPESPGPLFGK